MEEDTRPVHSAPSSIIHSQPTEQSTGASATPAVTVAFGPERQKLTCPYCYTLIFTQVVSEANSKTHCCAALLCLFCCWPCVCLLYCTDCCRNRNHYCPHCRAYLGAYISETSLKYVGGLRVMEIYSKGS